VACLLQVIVTGRFYRKIYAIVIKFINLLEGLFICKYTFVGLLGKNPVFLFMSAVETGCHLKHISVTVVKVYAVTQQACS
jgi:hypothetical protein